MDIVPTLVELAAPAGFKYHSFGQSLFDPARTQVGSGFHATIGADWVLRTQFSNSAVSLWDMQTRPSKPEELQAFRRGQAVRALSWWRIIKGPKITAD